MIANNKRFVISLKHAFIYSDCFGKGQLHFIGSKRLQSPSNQPVHSVNE
jgi:hypothetical protein